MKYRPEIDGLRAVAVLPVILFHAGLTIFSGGFIGVDVFFVISGYLITTILLNELREGKFSIANFYKRRARRILPALFLVILCCLPFAWIYMLPTQLKDFSQSILATVFFFANFHFWGKSGYFAPDTDKSPLLHTWSLAVEEQYYIFFPLLLLYLWRKKPQYISVVIISGIIISLGLTEFVSRRSPEANFYLAHTRIWELFAGSLAAYLNFKKPFKTSNLLSLIGLIAIIISIFIFDSQTIWPSYNTILPVFGAALVILFSSPKTIAYKILSLKAFVGIGLISYSAYLWHQPIFAFAKIISLHEPTLTLMLALSGLSIFLAFLSWKYVEMPFRKQQFKLFSPQKGLALVTLLLITASLVGNISKGAIWRYPPEVEQILAAKFDKTRVAENCQFSVDKKDIPEECWMNLSPRKTTILLGDSHSEMLSSELNNSMNKLGENLKTYLQSGCHPVTKLARVSRNLDCAIYAKNSYAAIQNSQYKTIIIHARWPLYAESTMFDNQEGGVEGGATAIIDVANKADFASANSRKERVLHAYTAYVENLLSLGKKVIVVHAIPEVGWDVPEYTAKKYLKTGTRTETSTSYAVFKKRNEGVFEAFNSIQHPNLHHFYPHKYFCSEKTQRCMNATLNQVYYKDDDHLSNTGVRIFADDLAKLVRQVNQAN